MMWPRDKHPRELNEETFVAKGVFMSNIMLQEIASDLLIISWFQGVTQIKTRDTVFRRNDAFTKPIEEYWNEPKPYELEDYPKMWLDFDEHMLVPQNLNSFTYL